MILGALRLLDSLRTETGLNVSQRGNLEIVHQPQRQGEIPFCHIPLLHPYLDLAGDDGVPTVHSSAIYSIDYDVTAMLAMQHLNTGDGSVFPELAGFNETCPVRFTAEIVDTRGAPNVGVDRVLALTGPDDRRPCAFLGAMYSTVTSPTAVVTGLRGYAQMSDSSSGIFLDDKNTHPYFARTMPRDDAMADSAVRYFREVLKVRHLAIVHVSDSWGNGFASAFQKAVQDQAKDMTAIYVDLPQDATPASIDRVVKKLKETQYRYFVGLLRGDMLVDLYPELVRNGLADTPEHSWYFTDSIDYRPKGSGYIVSAGGKFGDPRFEAVLAGVTAFKKSPDDMDFLRSKLPVHEDDPVPAEERSALYDSLMDEFMNNGEVDTWAAFTYDAIVTMAMAACNVTLRDEILDGESHFKAITETVFTGASGAISYERDTGSRESLSGVFELQQTEVPADGDWSNEVDLESPTTHIYHLGNWVEQKAYQYFGGAVEAPPDLPPVETNNNYTPTAIRAVSYSFSAVGIGLAIALAVWTFVRRNTRVVRASQPIFMELICFGTLLLSLSIIPMGIDPGIASQRACDVACMGWPWLLCVGITVVFGALFTKTDRILKVLKAAATFSRIQIGPKDVIKPLLGMLFVNVVILSLWTAIAPMTWQTVVLEEDFFGRPTETVGFCSASPDSWAWTDLVFLSLLGAVNLGAIALALWSASRAQKISTEFAETKYIFRALGLLSVVAFTGLPSLVIARDKNYAAFVFLYSSIVTAMVLSVQLFIFVPKIQRTRHNARMTRLTQAAGGGGGGRASGVGIKIEADGRTRDNLLEEIQELRGEIARYRRGSTNASLANSAGAKAKAPASTTKASVTLVASSINATSVSGPASERNSSVHLASIAETPAEGNTGVNTERREGDLVDEEVEDYKARRGHKDVASF